MLLYEVFTKDLPMSDKAQFIDRVLFKNIYGAGIENNFKNQYGKCNIEQSDEGISIEFYDGEGTKWKTELDWWDCAAYVESMIADGAYQTHAPYSEIDRMMEEHPRRNVDQYFKRRYGQVSFGKCGTAPAEPS